MKLKWTNKALSDLNRLYEFLAAINPEAAIRVVQSLTTRPVRLLEQPCIGEKLKEFYPREVRRLIIGYYEVRYEIQEDIIYLLRIWHTREER